MRIQILGETKDLPENVVTDIARLIGRPGCVHITTKYPLELEIEGGNASDIAIIRDFGYEVKTKS